MTSHLAVIDASVGVKWFRQEAGSETATQLLQRHLAGEVLVWAPEHTVTEVLSVVKRDVGAGYLEEAWQRITHAQIGIARLDSRLVAEAARQCDLLGCSFYDALAPALALLLEAPLYSADQKAHGMFPGIQLIG